MLGSSCGCPGAIQKTKEHAWGSLKGGSLGTNYLGIHSRMPYRRPQTSQEVDKRFRV